MPVNSQPGPLSMGGGSADDAEIVEMYEVELVRKGKTRSRKIEREGTGQVTQMGTTDTGLDPSVEGRPYEAERQKDNRDQRIEAGDIDMLGRQESAA